MVSVNNEEKTYHNLSEYFADHPEDEEEFVEQIARLEEERFVDYPEDW